MDDIKSPILKSAIESLEHGLDHSTKKTPKDWRFAILHVDQAVELILKEKLVLMGKSIYKGKKSLNLHETFNELKKQGIIIPEKPIIEEAHNIRNRTQHRGHTFIKEIITYYIEEEYKFVKKFLKTEMNIDISQIIELETKPSFERYESYSLNKQIKLANNQINNNPADAILSIFEALNFTLSQNFLNSDINSAILKLKEKKLINESEYKNLLEADKLRHRITDILYQPSIEETKKAVKIVDDVTKRINNQNRDLLINIEQFPEMIEDYLIELEMKDYSRKTIESYKSIINKFYNFLQRENDLYDNKKFLRTFKKYMGNLKRDHDISQNYFALITGVIKKFLEFNHIDALKGFEAPKRIESIPKLLSKQEVENLINAFDKKSDHYSRNTEIMNLRNKIILTLLYSSGLKASELKDIYINDVNFDDRIIIVEENEKDRKITFDEETKDLINEYIEKRDYDSDFLFVSRLENHLTPEYIRKIVKKHANEAGIKKDVNPRVLRYSFENHHQKRDMDIQTLKNVYDRAKTV